MPNTKMFIISQSSAFKHFDIVGWFLLSLGNYFITQKSKAWVDFHLKLHIGFHCQNCFICTELPVNSFPLMQFRTAAKTGKMTAKCVPLILLPGLQLQSFHCELHMQSLRDLQLVQENVISHQKLLCLYFISLAYTHA